MSAKPEFMTNVARSRVCSSVGELIEKSYFLEMNSLISIRTSNYFSRQAIRKGNAFITLGYCFMSKDVSFSMSSFPIR